MALGGILPLLFALLIWLLPESVRFLVIKQRPRLILAILNRLYPDKSATT